MRSFVLFLLATLSVSVLPAQFNTPTLDGTIAAGEYGTHTDGVNQQTSGAVTWYMTWDNTFLYLAATGLNPNNDAVNLYIDADPALPVNGNNTFLGSLTTEAYDQVTTELPFQADYFGFVKTSYNEWKNDNAAGAWGAGTTFSVALSVTGTSIEFRVPWTDITGGARPASFNWMAFLSYDNAGSNGTFSPVPVLNPTGAAASTPITLWATRYYTVESTDNATATSPFALNSFAYREDNSAANTGGYVLNPGTFHDITVNDNSINNLDNEFNTYLYDNAEICNRVLLDNGTFEVSGKIFIGTGSGLFPNDNTVGNVLATINVNEEVILENRGRLDCVPELSVAGDEDNRRITFNVIDTLTIEAATVAVGLFRFGDVTIQPTGVMRSSTTSAVNTDIEFSMSTIDNNGRMDFVGGNGSTVNFYTRGFIPGQDNVVFLTSSAGTGVFNFNTLLIGTQTGYLRPVNTAPPITINLSGDLNIYSNLVAVDGTGELNFAFVGTGEQYIRGTIGETSEPVYMGGTPSLPVEVYFNDITINNNNGLGDNNANADVFFQTYSNIGTGNINYFIGGTLTLQSGDWVTRDRVTPNAPFAVHELTLLEGGTVSYAGATSDIGGAPSCFIDGPFRREVATAALSTEEFPVGKSGLYFGVEVGDYRRLVLQVDQATAASNVYIAETFLGDRSGTYAWPDPLPELISIISNIRYWNVQDTSSTMTFDQVFVNLSYGDDEYSDAVPDAAALRIVKEDGAGQWYNVQPLGVGGSASPNGEITSLDIQTMPITPFGDMTLANIDGFFNPLETNWIRLQAEANNGVVDLSWEIVADERLRITVMRDGGNGFEAIEAEERIWGEVTDFDAPAGQLVYRLCGTTAEGNAIYSNAVAVNVEKPAFRVQEDHSTITLLRTQPELAARIEVMDLAGRVSGAFSFGTGQEKLTIEKGQFTAGHYLLRLSDGVQSYTERIQIKSGE